MKNILVANNKAKYLKLSYVNIKFCFIYNIVYSKALKLYFSKSITSIFGIIFLKEYFISNKWECYYPIDIQLTTEIIIKSTYTRTLYLIYFPFMLLPIFILFLQKLFLKAELFNVLNRKISAFRIPQIWDSPIQLS